MGTQIAKRIAAFTVVAFFGYIALFLFRHFLFWLSLEWCWYWHEKR